MSYKDRLGDWGAYAVRNRGRVLLGAAMITLVSIPLAWRAATHLDVNLFNQASGKLQRWKIMRELSEDFGGDLLAAVITIPDKPGPEQIHDLKDFGMLLRNELEKVGAVIEDRQSLNATLLKQLPEGEPWFRHVECRTGQGIELALRKIVQDYPFALLTPADIETLKKLFDPKKLDEKMTEIVELKTDLPPNSAEVEKLRTDPLNILELAQNALHSRLATRQQAMSGDEGFFISPDKTTMIVVARTALPGSRLDFDAVAMRAAQRAENRAIAAFRTKKRALSVALKGTTFTELAPGESPGTMQVGYTGIAAVSVENEMSLKSDMIINTASSLAGVLILFLIAFRSLVLTFDVMWTMVLIILWTVAFAGATKGGMSLLGGAFTAVPVGLCTDYMILLHNTYQRILHTGTGVTREDAMRKALTECGSSIITASTITAFGFMGVGFTHLIGLAEFGILGGVSALLGCAVMILVYPAALCRAEGTHSRKKKLEDFEPLGLGIPTWGRLLEHYGVRMACLSVGVIVAGGCILLIAYGPDPGPERVLGVKFDPELGNLRSLKIKAIPLRDRIVQRFGFGFSDLRIVVEASDEDRAFAGAAEVAGRLQPFVAAGELSPNGSVLDFMPSPRQQQATLDALKTFDLDAATAEFRKVSSARFGEKNATAFFKPFLKILNEIRARAAKPEVLRLSTVMQSSLSHLLAQFVRLDSDAQTGGKSRVRLVSSWLPSNPRGVAVAPGSNPLEKPASWYERVCAAAEQNQPEGVAVRVTAPRMVGFELKDSTLNDCAWITGIASVCVAISLGVSFRSLVYSLLATTPLIFAYLTMLAGVPLSQKMGWDFSLNFVNLLMFPLLLGSAIDYGVYMVYEAVSPRRPGSAELMRHTGRSVFYCMGTTLIGFGSFVTSSYTGLVSMGVASLFGYSGALFGALVVLPAILGLLRERTPAPIAVETPDKEVAGVNS